MNCECKVLQRRLTPGVFNLKQYLNDTETMRWNLSSRYLDDAQTRDAADYNAYLHMYRDGKFNVVQLGKEFNKDGSMALIWNVGKLATWMKDYVHYQIVFCKTGVSALNVLGFNDGEYNGVYALDSEAVDDDFRVYSHPETGRQIKHDAVNNHWALYDADGTTVLDCQQIAGLAEPFYGVWGKVAVGNGNAAAWFSDEAIIYISESIAADEAVVGNFPTILQQILEYQQRQIIKSTITVKEAEITEDDWHEDGSGDYFVNSNVIIPDIPNGCSIIGVRLLKRWPDGGYSDVGNIRFTQAASTGDVLVFSAARVAGKMAITIKGSANHVFISSDDLDKTGGGVSSVNGKSGEVSLNAGEVGAYSKTETDRLMREHDENKFAHENLARVDEVYSKSDTNSLLNKKLATPEAPGNNGQVLSLVEGVPAWVDPSGGGGSSKAADILITDAGNYFAGANVETALQEIGKNLSGLETALKGI